MVESRKTFFGVVDYWTDHHSRPFEKDYELSKKVLGRGDFCEIRQCQDKHSSEYRTVKVYRKCELDEDLLKLIRKEVELLSRLDHPALTKVHAVYQDESKIYMVIDTIRGSSIYEKIFKAGQIAEPEAALIT